MTMVGKTKYKVGDRVRLLPTKGWCIEAKEDALKPGKIVEVCDLNSYRVVVQDTKAPMGFWIMDTNSIELIKEEYKQLLLFELI